MRQFSVLIKIKIWSNIRCGQKNVSMRRCSGRLSFVTERNNPMTPTDKCIIVSWFYICTNPSCYSQTVGLLTKQLWDIMYINPNSDDNVKSPNLLIIVEGSYFVLHYVWRIRMYINLRLCKKNLSPTHCTR